MIKQLTIFGVGLIGGSLAMALRKSNACEKIVGCSRNEQHLRRAVELGVIDQYSLDAAEAVREADMILLAVPMGAMESVLAQICDHLKPGAIVTDAGSAKSSVIEAAKKAFGTVPDFFVPGHPIAGREKSGVDAALENLFVDHKVILTPLESTSPDAIAQVTRMWELAGAEVQTLGVAQHDLVLAATCHLPHVLAYSLVNTLSSSDFVAEIFQFAAGGFRDLSRIASSDPVMWRDICLENKSAILDVLQSYQDNLSSLRNLIEQSNGEALLDAFSDAKRVRDSNLLAQQTIPE